MTGMRDPAGICELSHSAADGRKRDCYKRMDHDPTRMSKTPRYWFCTPQFGFGYRTPIAWEGWAFDLVTFAAFVATGLWIRGHQQAHPMIQLGFFLGVPATNLAIRHWKSEPRSWG